MDQGGTFTDLVSRKPNGRITIEKVLSSTIDMASFSQRSRHIRRGTTVATNALLERKGVKAVLITNIGFGDLREIGDQRREHLFDINARREPPLGSTVLEIEGRIDANGRILAPAVLPVDRAKKILLSGITSAAVVLLHGPRAPQEEQRIARQLLAMGFQHVSVGSEVSAKIGFTVRLQSTLADACLTPLLPREKGLYMKSNGGLSAAEDADWRGVNAVLSGPAGGAIAVEKLLSRLGIERAFGLDMGGTSADVCHVYKKVRRVDRLVVNHWPLQVPSLHIETVAAGGGSIVTEQEGIVKVGPHSAGSAPGPACYGRGGPATLSDCEAVLGRLVDFPNVCGSNRDQPLDIVAARTVLQKLDPTSSVESIAMNCKEVAAEEMAAAILRHAAYVGVSPADHSLVVFGGAGAAHACAIAQRLEISQVVIPALAGVFSAVGIGWADRRTEVSRMILNNDIVSGTTQVLEGIPRNGTIELSFDVRYKGTSVPLMIPYNLENELSLVQLENAFRQQHSQVFGFQRDLPIEVIAVTAVLSVLQETSEFNIPDVAKKKKSVRAFFDQQWQMVPVFAFQEVEQVIGPAIILVHGSTVVLPKGWRCRRHQDALILQDILRQYQSLGVTFHPARTAIFARRIMAVAEEMGEMLARLARSVSIRERRDFSCAVFDARGNLVANAPHVPVHLGAMGETVRELLAHKERELQPGQAWLSNDPYSGGSHLPDITVMMPVYEAGERIAFVATRGHHIDIGGTHPGSMPPNAKHISEEGMLWHHQKWLEDDTFCPIDLSASRQPIDVRADLEAQAAACLLGVKKIARLCETLKKDVFVAQLKHVQDHAERVCLRWMRENQGSYQAAEKISGDLVVQVGIEISANNGLLELSAMKSPSNLNTPKSVARACLLYVLRALINEDIPLNEGTLRPWRIVVNEGGLFDPKYPDPVAGGNVESSQHLVDAILRALDAQASSQGTMNNLCVGTERGTFYETIGGGAGASRDRDGGSAVQVHMTNTKATDVEELEHRFPVQLQCWKIRTDSGGKGEWNGGDGMIKEWLFLAPAQISILATRRCEPGTALNGGESGLCGVDYRNVGDGWEVSPAEWTAKPGDRLRICTPGGSGFGVSKTVQESSKP